MSTATLSPPELAHLRVRGLSLPPASNPARRAARSIAQISYYDVEDVLKEGIPNALAFRKCTPSDAKQRKFGRVRD